MAKKSLPVSVVKRKGQYLETFSSYDDTWSVWLVEGIKYTFSHSAEAFGRNAYLYDYLVVD